MGLLEALAVLDSHQAVLKPVPFPDMVMHIAGSHHFDAALLAKAQQRLVAGAFPVDQVLLQFDVIVRGAEPVQVLPDQVASA